MDKESANSKQHQESHAHHGHGHQHAEHSHPHEHGHEHSQPRGGQRELPQPAHQEHDEFLASIRSLKEAEKSALTHVEAARKQAADIEARGREKAVEISAKAQEKAVGIKNEIIAKGRVETEKEVGSILNEAKKQSERIRAKRLLEREVSALSQSVL